MTQALPKTCDNCSVVEICTYSPPTFNKSCAHNHIVNQSHIIKRKEILYTYRDPFKNIYAVKSGAIKTFQIGINGMERILNFYLPGEVIGLEAIQIGFYPYSAIALTQSEVCEIPFDNLLNVTTTHPSLQSHLINIFGERINQGHYVSAPTAPQRLASFILDMAKRLCDRQEQVEFDLPMSRYDIGNYLNLAPETISRLFTRFQQSDYLQVHNKKIILGNTTELQWIAQDG